MWTKIHLFFSRTFFLVHAEETCSCAAERGAALQRTPLFGLRASNSETFHPSTYWMLWRCESIVHCQILLQSPCLTRSTSPPLGLEKNKTKLPSLQIPFYLFFSPNVPAEGQQGLWVVTLHTPFAQLQGQHGNDKLQIVTFFFLCFEWCKIMFHPLFWWPLTFDW